MDRISGLPTFIIHHIMSYLSTKEVARISILSKRWNQLRISFPIFVFDQSDYLTEDESIDIPVSEEERLALRDRLKEYMEFVDASLLRFCELKFSMHKFKLFISIVDDEESAPYIEKWIGLAIGKDVKEFDLQFLTDGDTPYTLPPTIFSARSVTTVKLVSCKLENISDTVRLNSLIKLSLDRVLIDEELVQKLCSECPLLEEMVLLECWGSNRLCVSKALKLKIMTISSYELESVQIVVPNLQELELHLWNGETPKVIDIIGCSQLKRLNFGRFGLTDRQFHHFISSFPLLEDLILESCNVLERITISSNQLKKFRVSSCFKMKALDLDTPNLLSFTYANSSVQNSTFESVKIVAPILQELVLEFSEEITPRVIDITGCSQLKKLKFKCIGLTNQEFHRFISSFPLLEDVILLYCEFLERIKISSNQLKKFQVSSCFNMKILDLDTPNLLSFTYKNSPIPTSRINALCPWHVEFSSEVTFDTQWSLKLREFLGVSNQIEVLRISAMPTVSSFMLEEFKKSFSSPSCNVGSLELHTDVPLSEYRILLDCLLWICYPRTLSLRTDSCKAQHKLFESFYNELKNRDVSCCSSYDVKCWRHYLEDIKVKSFKYREDLKLVGADYLMKLLSTNNLRMSDLWSILPSGTIKFQLDWCFPLSTKKA